MQKDRNYILCVPIYLLSGMYNTERAMMGQPASKIGIFIVGRPNEQPNERPQNTRIMWEDDDDLRALFSML